MKITTPIFFAGCLGLGPVSLIHAESTVAPLIPTVDGPVFAGDPPTETHPWAVHDRNRPLPTRVEPGTASTHEQAGRPPSDAVVLFDGTEASLANWQSVNDNGNAPMAWKVENGALVVEPRSGNIRTKDHFGDVQLHLEWSVPTDVTGSGQGRANSGVFLMGITEIQILDNYNNPTYADGHAGSVYGVNPPFSNPLRAPGEWQTYDIVFRRPIFKDGVEVDPGHFTVFINGVLVQDATPLEGGGGFMRRTRSREFPEAGPIMLQDHGDRLMFRNIWVRPLAPRAVEGGTDGRLEPAAAMAKRSGIAAGIRAHAATLDGRARMFRTMESLVYEVDAGVLEAANAMIATEVESIQNLSAQEQEDQKGRIRELEGALRYLAGCGAIADDHPSRVAIDAIVVARGWREN